MKDVRLSQWTRIIQFGNLTYIVTRVAKVFVWRPLVNRQSSKTTGRDKQHTQRWKAAAQKQRGLLTKKVRTWLWIFIRVWWKLTLRPKPVHTHPRIDITSQIKFVMHAALDERNLFPFLFLSFLFYDEPASSNFFLLQIEAVCYLIIFFYVFDLSERKRGFPFNNCFFFFSLGGFWRRDNRME